MIFWKMQGTCTKVMSWKAIYFYAHENNYLACSDPKKDKGFQSDNSKSALQTTKAWINT